MQKLISQFKFKDNVDEEQFWNDWNETYSTVYRGREGLESYTIGRYLGPHVPPGADPSRFPKYFWGMETFWWAEKDDCYKALKEIRADRKTSKLLEEFRSKIQDYWSAWFEERLILDSGYTELAAEGRKFFKMLVMFGLRDEKTNDETWKMWTVEHSQCHLHIGTRKYTASRLSEILEGDPGWIWGIPEIWYDARFDCDYDHAMHMREIKTRPKDKKIFKEFHSRVYNNWGGFSDENKIV